MRHVLGELMIAATGAAMYFASGFGGYLFAAVFALLCAAFIGGVLYADSRR